jgi:hypothetical protein
MGDDGAGVVLEGLRVVVHGVDVRAAKDVADVPIQSAWRVPARLGGGYLFRARGALYASDAFDGLLRPVVTLPADVAEVAFASKAALVRSDTGERWMIEPATGKRLPIAPAGLLDVAALDDGRAAALVEGPGLLVTTDAGEHWTDATARLRAPAKRVFVDHAAGRDDALWVETQGGPALRLMPGGRLAEFDAPPAATPAPALRPKQPAWREEEAPIRRAVRAGAPAGDGTALVVSSGDLVKVDLVTGVVDVLAAGKLPPDATCVGTRTADDVVFTCGRPNGGSFVVSHALDKAPVVEQTFTESGRFVVSDDGGIAYLGQCDKPVGNNRKTACVRSPGGGWQQIDFDAAGDAGTGPTFNVVRWVPRADGGAIAVVSDVGGVSNAWGLVDGRTGELHAWPTDAVTPMLRAALQATGESTKGSPIDLNRLAERGWTVTPQGTLRGWASLGGGTGAIEIGVDGSVQTSAFTFERVAGAGSIALARQRDGRIWQTLDRGATWSEVAGPPASKPGGWLDTHACSLVGCDLGQWYRVGWAPTPPATQPPATSAPPAPRIERAPPPVMTCRPAGEVKRAAAPRGERSPEDLGLGASRVAASDPNGRFDFLRLSFPRKLVGAVRDTDAADDAAPRAILHGPATQPGDDRLVVSGFNRDVMALVRNVSFVPAFDPLGAIRRGPIAMRDLVQAARAAGVPLADALREDPVPSGVVPLTPADPAAPADLLVQIATGALAVVRAAPSATVKPRFAFEPGRGDEWRIVSAAALDGEAVAWLEEDSSGHARVVRLGAGATPATAFELDAPPSSDLYPANIDALAVGPRGDLAVVRAPSGSEPASAMDPAVVVAPGVPSTPLAPWSTLLPADDPACKSDAAGWRVTLQTIAPWVRLVGASELRGMDEATMLARVRWSTARVCLEAVELRTQDTTVSAQGTSSQWGSPWDSPVESWVVARFAGGAAAGRVIVVAGGEQHQPLECRLGPLTSP